MTWEMRLIFGPAVIDVVSKVTIKKEQGSPHVGNTGRGGIRSR
jgi:hypothetical protein